VTVVDEPVLVTDRSIWPAITALTSCLCQTLEARGLPPVCICTPLPGEQIATDYVTESAGMAWVRLEAAWPSTAFPNQAVGSSSCKAPLAFAIEIGLAYCAPMSESDGTPPDLASQFEAVELQLAAMAAMRAAIECCMPANTADYAIGQYTPMGPEGGVVGGSWSIFVAEGAI
jgi:hypothetical protein